MGSKNFMEILFKPGFAVQARELTQMQTMLQEQIKRFGNNVYKDGTVIFGMDVTLNLKQAYVKVTDQDTNSVTINNTDLVNYLGHYLVGRTSGVRALVKFVSPGLVASNPDLKTFYIDYVSSGTTGLSKTFVAGEVLEIEGNTSKTFVIPADTTTYFSIGLGSFITVNDGIVYANGYFVLHVSQTLPLEKYATQPSYKVGYRLNEEIVNIDADLTLLDPANGSLNYAAPGADRLKITTVLSRIPLTDSPDSKFYLLYEVDGGQIRRKYTKTQYADLRNEMAARTYDESGNYTVKAFPILVREHLHTTSPENGGLVDAVAAPHADRGGNQNLLAVGFEAGKAYVSGYEFETFMTEYVVINKGIATQTYSQQLVSTAYGNYLAVKEVCGNWDLELGTTVKLLSVGPTAITSGTYGNTADPSGGTTIGTAKVHAVRYVSGTPGSATAVYNIYLYDIVLTSSTITNVLGLYSATGTSFAKVVTPAAGLQSSSYNNMLFRVPASAIKTFAPGGTLNNNYVYRKKIIGTIASAGQICTLTLPSDELWATGNTITPTKLLQNFYVTIATATGSSKSYLNGQPIELGTGPTPNRVLTWVSNQQITLDMGETFAAGATLTVWADVQKKNVRPILKSIKKHCYVKIDTRTNATTNVGPWDLGVADVYAIEGIYAGSYSGATPGTYLEANTDVTNQFVLDNGQRDNSYIGAQLSKSPTASITFTDRNLLVKLSYFTHDYSTSGDRRYLSIDSYPVDDTGTPPVTTIPTWGIPVYTSPVSGVVYDLRDTIDFRVRVSDASGAGTTTIGAATANPVNSTVYDLGSGHNGYMVPLPDNNFTTDIQFYLGRIDRLSIDQEGNFIAVPGTPSLTPAIPNEQDHTMSLALVTIPPYPSLSRQAARAVGRSDYVISIKTLDNRRYTMRDIGVIEQRVNRIEYYTALSLLESNATDSLIPNSSGVDRFKNGILVDGFTGHNVGNVFDSEYKCAIDTRVQVLRPSFVLENTDLLYSSYSTGATLHPADAKLFVTTTNDFVEGETVSVIGASGNVVHQVRIDGTHVKLYVENVTGTFTNITIAGATSGTTGTITSSVVPQNGHLVTLPYQHKVLAQNKFASQPMNVVSQLLYTYNGEITLDPPQDTWVDTSAQPDVQVNFDGNQDAWQYLPGAWGTTWGAWKTVWQGNAPPMYYSTSSPAIQANTIVANTPRQYTLLSTQRQTRQGIQLSVVPTTQVQSIGSRVIDTTIVPFMRSITVTFVADRLKPNTVVYPFFDGEDVSANCRPCDTSQVYTAASTPTSRAHPVLSTTLVNGVYGAVLKTDANGRVAGQFTIPANRFRTGTKPFRLSDDSKNRSSFITTAAISNFTANGLSQTVQNTIVSTRVPQVVSTTVSDSRTINDTEGYDPGILIDPAPINVDNTFTAINNTTSIHDNTFVPTPPAPTPPCIDCGTSTVSIQPPTFTPPPKWGIDNSVPVEQIGPPPLTTSTDETVKAGSVGGSGGSGYSNVSLDTTLTNKSPIGGNWNSTDPTAQSFFVQNMPFGTYISKVDLYFKTTSSTLPITVQIREMVNGYPGTTVVPFGTATLYPADINVSADSTVATEFAFPSPVFLQNNTEYCLVLLPAGNNPDYQVWISELGADTVGTVPIQRISEQPFSGILFVSANNNTWSALQARDLKFTLYRADFNINALASVYLKNAPIDYIKVTTAGVINAGDTVVANPNTGVTGIVQQYDTTTGVAKIYVTAGVFTGATALKFGAALVDATIVSIGNKIVNSFAPNIGSVEYTPTVMSWSYRGTSSAGVQDLAFTPFTISNTMNLLGTENAVFSYSSEVSTLTLPTTEGSLMLRADFYTKTSTVSPVIDLRKSSVALIANVVNNDSTGETTVTGNATAKYVTRKVILDNGQDAEDIQVYMTQNTPAGSSVQVYAKMLNGSDSDLFNTKSWVLMSVINSPSGTQNADAFAEWQYGLPASVLSGGIYQYVVGSTTYTKFKTFAIKIVMLSSNTSVIPKVKDLRVIALQI